ncbi:MAG: polyphosphate kinase 2 family protein [Verrucomicrobiaceae bacterium]|nr:MAG: polyphosphate kinase 2 family protein [Verrucomicrobiaceae bacterium]
MKIYRIRPGTRVKLTDFDPNGETELAGDKERGLAQLDRLKAELQQLQRMLYAERRHRLLIILQGMDGSGKDGTVRHVFSGIDPHGLRVISFKSPTAQELDRDFLWRIHREVPAKGEIVVFNRSHYEDVVAVNVKNLAPKTVWEKRYSHIVNFERMLVDEGTTILKFFLHISREEQRRRLQSRLQSPDKHWKFNPDDITDRRLWPQFVDAYEDVLSRTATAEAPWFVVPANRKYYRNAVIAGIIGETLAKLDLKYPAPAWDLSQVTVE